MVSGLLQKARVLYRQSDAETMENMGRFITALSMNTWCDGHLFFHVEELCMASVCPLPHTAFRPLNNSLASLIRFANILNC